MTQRAPINPSIIREVSLFRTLNDAQVRQIQGVLREWHCRKGEIIFHQGDPGGCLYLIVAGRVRVYLVGPDGREVTIRIYERNMSFGEFSVLDGMPRSASASAVSDVRALVLYREDFLGLLRQNFELVERVIAMLTERVRYTTTFFEQLAFLSVPGRIAALLVQLASTQADPNVAVRLNLTQQEIAAFVNTTREWVNRALHDFADQGLIRLERGSVIVLNRAGLQRRIQ